MCVLFSNLQKSFTRDPIYKDRIRKNFENIDNARLNDFIGKARTRNKKPQWLGDEVWKGLQEHYGMNHTKNYVKKPQKIDLMIPRVLDHLFIPAVRSLCTSIEGVWYHIANLRALFDLFVSLWCLTCFPKSV